MGNRSGVIFLFQAEDGIRDLVRSRGLGDVYKRQGGVRALTELGIQFIRGRAATRADAGIVLRQIIEAVSYTHLTLPTSDLV